MVRGRQLEELAPALLLPLFSLTTFLFSTTTKNLASRNNLQVSVITKEQEDSLLLLLLFPSSCRLSKLLLTLTCDLPGSLLVAIWI
jgi:hypothetical protein